MDFHWLRLAYSFMSEYRKKGKGFKKGRNIFFIRRFGGEVKVKVLQWR